MMAKSLVCETRSLDRTDGCFFSLQMRCDGNYWYRKKPEIEDIFEAHQNHLGGVVSKYVLFSPRKLGFSKGVENMK